MPVYSSSGLLRLAQILLHSECREKNYYVRKDGDCSCDIKLNFVVVRHVELSLVTQCADLVLLKLLAICNFCEYQKGI